MNEWDRDEENDEPQIWFERFEIYRMLGAKRSMLKAENASRKAAQMRPTGQPSGSWKEAAEKWHWKARAQAWDDSETERRREEWEEERQGEKRERIQIWRAYRAKLLQALATIDIKEAKWYDITQGLKISMESLAGEYDDLPTQHHEIGGAPEGGRKVPIREVVVNLPASLIETMQEAEDMHAEAGD